MIKARYTVVLKTLLDDPEVKELIDKAMSTYPLYEKKSKEEWIPSVVPTRSELNEKILNYYKYREIGFETIGRFVDELEIALKEIMPYYNQMLFTLDQDYNILYNVDYDKEVTSTQKGESTDKSTNVSEAHDTGTTNSSGTDKGKNVHSDTPQGVLNITKENIDGVNYADEAQWSDNATTTQSTVVGDTEGRTEINQNGTNQSTGEMHERVFGNYGQMSYQYLVAKYRELVMNVEQRIINDRRIAELFMLIY